MATKSQKVDPADALYDDDGKPIHPSALSADALYDDNGEPIHPSAPASIAQWTGSRGVIPPTPAPPPSWSELPGNILPSAANLVGSVGHALAHPLDTAHGLAGVALGGLERGASKIGPMLSPPSPGMDATSAIDPSDEDFVQHGKMFDAFLNTLTQRYGSLDNAKATAIHDPTGFVADVAAVLSGGAKMLGIGADAATAANATRLARGLTATAVTARTASEWIDPVQNAIRAIAPVVKGAGSLTASLLGQTTGAGKQAIQRAFEGSGTFKDYLRGKRDPMELLQNMKDAFQDLKDQRSADYRGKLVALPTNQTLDLTQLKQNLPDMLKEFGVKFTAQGNSMKLNFSRSTISSATEQAKVRQIVQDVYGWGSKPGDLAPLGVDTLKRRVGDFYSESGQGRALVKGIEGAIKDELNKVPGYEDMTKSYATATQMLNQVERELALKNLNPATSLNRLTAAFRKSNEFRTSLLDAVADATKHLGVDFNDARAGAGLSNIMPEGLRGILDLTALLGTLASKGTIPYHDLAYLGLTSPRLVGETMVLLSNMRKTIAPVGTALRQPPVYRAAQYANGAEVKGTEHNPTIGPPPFAVDDENGVQQVMRDHGFTREQAIAELRARGLVQ